MKRIEMHNKAGNALLAASLLLLAVLVQVCPAAAQTARFVRQYGGGGDDWGHAVQQTNDNGYIIAGRTNSFGAVNDDVYLIKTNPSGDTLWTRTYGGSGYDQGWAVLQTPDSGFLIAGSSALYPTYHDAYFIRTDSQGDTLWTKRYNKLSYNGAFALSATDDGGFIAAGYTFNGGFYIYLIRMNAAGDTLWTKSAGNGACGYNGGTGVRQTADRGFIVIGATTMATAGGYDVYLLKTDSLGNTLWTKTIGGPDEDYGVSVQPTLDGGYVIGGATKSYGAGWYDIWLIKTDASGDTVWTKTYGGSLTEECGAVEQTADGGYIIGGSTASYGQGTMPDFYAIKTNASGGVIWSKTFGSTEWDGCYAVHQTADHGYIMTGYTSALMGTGPMDVYLVKTDSVGIASGVSGNPISRAQTITISLTASPNPFGAAVRVEYALPQSGRAVVVIYNALGEKVKTLIDRYQKSGGHAIFWDGKDEQGRRCAAGGYFCRLQCGLYSATKGIILVR